MEIPYICCFPCALLENTGNHLALWMCNWNRLRRFCSPSFCFFTFQKRYFQIRIRNLNPKMSTLTWTNLKVCSYDTKNYASGCVTRSIEDISRIDEVCYNDAESCWCCWYFLLGGNNGQIDKRREWFGYTAPRFSERMASHKKRGFNAWGHLIWIR